MMRDDREEFKGTEGQDNDQGLSTMTRKWSRLIMMSCTVSGVEKEGKLQMDSLRDCLSYYSSVAMVQCSAAEISSQCSWLWSQARAITCGRAQSSFCHG